LLASSFNAYRKITMKILNLNDLHWISHSPSCFHYRSLRDAEIVAFCFFISVFIYFCLVYVWDLNLKWSWWLEIKRKKLKFNWQFVWKNCKIVKNFRFVWKNCRIVKNCQFV
jgi:hypothetical protein